MEIQEKINKARKENKFSYSMPLIGAGIGYGIGKSINTKGYNYLEESIQEINIDTKNTISEVVDTFQEANRATFDRLTEVLTFQVYNELHRKKQEAPMTVGMLYLDEKLSQLGRKVNLIEEVQDLPLPNFTELISSEETKQELYDQFKLQPPQVYDPLPLVIGGIGLLLGINKTIKTIKNNTEKIWLYEKIANKLE